MIKATQQTSNLTPYLQFSRQKWAALLNSIPLTLTKEEIIKLQDINKDLSLEEVLDIYFPLSRLLNFYISSNLRHQAVLEPSCGTEGSRIPYIIGIAGSVAVGKSTTARVLQVLLSRWPEHRTVDIVTTDNFLHPNKVLKERNLMNKKGFPQSYDLRRLVNFVLEVKSGVQSITIPVYSHFIYDIVPYQKNMIAQPDILLLEGLNVLQNYKDHLQDIYPFFLSDFIDFSIYVDAPQEIIQNWYIKRFMTFRKGAVLDSSSYFHHYAQLSEHEAIATSRKLWMEINAPNLEENILPTRTRASLILSKSINHAVNQVLLRKFFFLEDLSNIYE
ncbi:type I pantothenate kinase [Candidatus Palibaumannia cicadellinicola]|uniref:Pantothenate kinase n=1 Tax=Candidatus Palibaumannia cicadellinicola TaxID=186490 RepID=A0A088MY51_9GAMM|nr:type I pantothenate kinase [Candidatus Baumannia cicadellinicola]AIN47275.1 Pantothenate kinase [Candidatus Baumannia cicadellinicola]